MSSVEGAGGRAGTRVWSQLSDPLPTTHVPGSRAGEEVLLRRGRGWPGVVGVTEPLSSETAVSFST